MRLKVEKLDMVTGGFLVAVLNKEDAAKADLFPMDRVELTVGSQKAIGIIDITDNIIKKGRIGISVDLQQKLNCSKSSSVLIKPIGKPKAISAIKKKLNGKTLTKEELNEIIKEVVNNTLSQVELSFFISGAYTQGLTHGETLDLIHAIVNNGETLDIKETFVLDKHCSGGVPGNRTTMVIVPLLAAAGYTVPKTSSRSITSPAGTADTMEVFAPVTMSVSKMRRVVEKTGGCMVWGGAMKLAGADDKMIKIRHPLSLDPTGLLLASIISKKKSVNATHVLIDLPVGHETKLKTDEEAKNLGKKFVQLGKELNMTMKVIITNGEEPIGNGIGPVLEARDVLWVLQNDPRAPQDLREKAIGMAGIMMCMAGRCGTKDFAEYLINSGKAYKKMMEIIVAQGGKEIDPNTLKPGKYSYDIKAEKRGTIRHINNQHISRLCRIAGAPQIKKAGMYLHKKVGDTTKVRDKLCTIYAESKHKLNEAIQFAKQNPPYKIQ